MKKGFYDAWWALTLISAFLFFTNTNPWLVAIVGVLAAIALVVAVLLPKRDAEKET